MLHIVPHKELEVRIYIMLRTYGEQRSIVIKLDPHHSKLVTHNWTTDHTGDQFECAPFFDYEIKLKCYNKCECHLLHWLTKEINDDECRYT